MIEHILDMGFVESPISMYGAFTHGIWDMYYNRRFLSYTEHDKIPYHLDICTGTFGANLPIRIIVSSPFLSLRNELFITRNDGIQHLQWALSRMIKYVNMYDKHTSEEWQKIYPSPKVIDPDGWDRKNYTYSWHQELIDEKEYHLRVMKSTCRWDSNSQADFRIRLSKLGIV